MWLQYVPAIVPATLSHSLTKIVEDHCFIYNNFVDKRTCKETHGLLVFLYRRTFWSSLSKSCNNMHKKVGHMVGFESCIHPRNKNNLNQTFK